MAHGLSCSKLTKDLPRSGLEPMSPALAGRFLTTAPPGKPASIFKNGKKKVFKKCLPVPNDRIF